MNTHRLKRLLASCYPARQPLGKNIVLLYHAVGSGPNSMPVAQFEAQMRSLVDLCAPNETKVMVTFDDGYVCLHGTVAPILKDLGISSAVYINTGWIADDLSNRCHSRIDLGHYPGEAFLTWSEVIELEQQGWEVGSHGVDHVDLTRVNDDELVYQLTQSRKDIIDKVGSCSSFAYTWGIHDARVRQAVSSAGYQNAMAAHHASISDKESTFALPRINIENRYSMTDFENIIRGKWDFLQYIQKAKRKLKGLT